MAAPSNNIFKKLDQLKKIGFSGGSQVNYEEFRILWTKNAKTDNFVSRNQAKKIYKQIMKIGGHELTSESLDGTIEEAKEGLPGLDQEQFYLILYFALKKIRIPMKDGIIFQTLFNPRCSTLMDSFFSYLKTPFSESAHNYILEEIWKLSKPHIPTPPIPSELWKDLGFQGTNPSTDFRGSGLCGVDCLEALVKFPEFSRFIEDSANKNDIPFAVAGINVVSIIFEFLGLGFRSPGVPACQCPRTYKTLFQLLFEEKMEEHTLEKQLEFVKSSFHKLFFLVFGLMEKEWRENELHYMDFPKIMTCCMDNFEKALKIAKNRYCLDLYLRENFNLDVPWLNLGNQFKITLPDNKFKSYSLNQNKNNERKLLEILTQLCEYRGIEMTMYEPRDPAGRLITNLDVSLEELKTIEISFLPPKPELLQIFDRKSIESEDDLPKLELFSIHLENDIIKFPYNPSPSSKNDILASRLYELSTRRNLENCVPFFLDGTELPNPNVRLSDVGTQEIAFLPGTPEQIEAYKKRAMPVISKNQKLFSVSTPNFFGESPSDKSPPPSPSTKVPKKIIPPAKRLLSNKRVSYMEEEEDTEEDVVDENGSKLDKTVKREAFRKTGKSLSSHLMRWSKREIHSSPLQRSVTPATPTGSFAYKPFKNSPSGQETPSLPSKTTEPSIQLPLTPSDPPPEESLSPSSHNGDEDPQNSKKARHRIHSVRSKRVNSNARRKSSRNETEEN